MSRLPKLAQWTRGGGSLRMVGKTGASLDHEVAPQLADDLAGEWKAADGTRADSSIDASAPLWTGEDDGDHRPGERLPVYNCSGVWRDPRTGDAMLTQVGLNSEAAFVRSECVLGQGSLWQEAAALSLVACEQVSATEGKRNRHDVRPWLLLVFHAQATEHVPRLVDYGVRYLAEWCRRSNVRRSELATNAAVMDALALLYRLREPLRAGMASERFTPANVWTVKRTDSMGQRFESRRQGLPTRKPGALEVPSLADRCAQLKIRRDSYREMRSLMFEVFRRRLEEAEGRFNVCADWIAPTTGSQGKGLADDTLWHPERDRERSTTPRRYRHNRTDFQPPKQSPSSRAGRVMPAASSTRPRKVMP